MIVIYIKQRDGRIVREKHYKFNETLCEQISLLLDEMQEEYGRYIEINDNRSMIVREKE